jgi:hypothetical protein
MRKKFSTGRLKTYKVNKPTSPIVRMVNVRAVLAVTLIVSMAVFTKAFWSSS